MVAQTATLTRTRDDHRGSPTNWDEIVKDHADQIYRLALRLTGNQHDAETLTQETFTKIFQSLGSYQPGAIEDWLHHITTNLFMEMVRRRARLRMQPQAHQHTDRLPGGGPGPDLARSAAYAEVAGHRATAGMAVIGNSQTPTSTLRNESTAHAAGRHDHAYAPALTITTADVSPTATHRRGGLEVGPKLHCPSICTTVAPLGAGYAGRGGVDVSLGRQLHPRDPHTTGRHHDSGRHHSGHTRDCSDQPGRHRCACPGHSVALITRV